MRVISLAELPCRLNESTLCLQHLEHSEPHSEADTLVLWVEKRISDYTCREVLNEAPVLPVGGLGTELLLTS